MKDIEKLKEEQQELKERLKRLIDFMNSEEFFSITEGEKSLLSSQRIGMEMYVIAFDALVAVLSYWLFKALPIAIACIATVVLVVSAVAVTFSVLRYWKHRYIK